MYFDPSRAREPEELPGPCRSSEEDSGESVGQAVDRAGPDLRILAGPSRGPARQADILACARRLELAAPRVELMLPDALLAPSWQDLPRARLGPILLFSFTAGANFPFVRTRWGAWAAPLAAYTVTKLGVPLVWIFPSSESQNWIPRRQPGATPARSAG